MSDASASGYQFGTFKGVFTPSILTILGVIMYLRTGWVLGHVGLALTLVIVTVSSSVTFLTGLSVSALATNMRVKGGGAYYMISRSLGVEAGGGHRHPAFSGAGGQYRVLRGRFRRSRCGGCSRAGRAGRRACDAGGVGADHHLFCGFDAAYSIRGDGVHSRVADFLLYGATA